MGCWSKSEEPDIGRPQPTAFRRHQQQRQGLPMALAHWHHRACADHLHSASGPTHGPAPSSPHLPPRKGPGSSSPDGPTASLPHLPPRKGPGSSSPEAPIFCSYSFVLRRKPWYSLGWNSRFLFYLFNIYLLCLAAPGLSRTHQIFDLLRGVCNLVPDQESSPGSLHWECHVSATRPQGSPPVSLN